MSPGPVTHLYSPPSARRLFYGAVGSAIAASAVYFAIALAFGPKGHAAVAQPDSLIFQQYARAMAEGRPYRFNEGDAPSTGSTSHLYPAALAVLYRLGARGDSLATAAFAFNAACFIGFLFFFALCARRIAPEAAPLGVALAALSGHVALAGLGQSDMGLFMLLSTGALAAALHHRPILLGIALAFCAWSRPEGLLLSLALVAVMASRFWRHRKRPSRPMLIAAGCGLGAFAAMLAFNYRLTGTTAFHSVVAKGLHHYFTPAGALNQATRALGGLAGEVFLGLADGPRALIALPIVGGALGAIGLASRDWKLAPTARVEAWHLLAGGASLFLVSFSGWDGIQHDRYLAWMLPMGLLYVAIGARTIADRLPAPRAFAAICVVLAGYQAMGWARSASVFAEACARTSTSREFARQADRALPAGSRVGAIGRAGLIYDMPRRSIVNVRGIVSPDFARPHDPLANAELLKHRPDLRFEAWLLPIDLTRGQWWSAMVGEPIALEAPVFGAANALALYAADWRALDGCLQPRTREARRIVRGMRPIDRLDIGYEADEARTGYEVYTRVSGARLLPFAEAAELAGERVAEVGRVVLGSETFRVRALPGRPMQVVMRTARTARAHINKPGVGIEEQTFTFVSPLELLVFLEGRPLRQASVELAAEGFTEATFEIPASAIRSDSIELTIGGDRVSLAYWFYQPSRSTRIDSTP